MGAIRDLTGIMENIAQNSLRKILHGEDYGAASGRESDLPAVFLRQLFGVPAFATNLTIDFRIP